jgi:hypothetical protein
MGHIMSKKKRRGMSMSRMVILLMVAIAVIGWALAAAGYAQSELGFKPQRSTGRLFIFVGLGQFLWNAIAQIPNIWHVAVFTVTERWGLLIVLAVLEAGAVGFGVWARQLERQFDKQDRRARRP